MGADGGISTRAGIDLASKRVRGALGRHGPALLTGSARCSIPATSLMIAVSLFATWSCFRPAREAALTLEAGGGPGVRAPIVKAISQQHRSCSGVDCLE